MKATLYGNKWTYNGAEATARTLIALQQFYGVRHIGNVGNTIRVEFPFSTEHPDLSYVEFVLSDNGGEINVEPVNMPDRLHKYFPNRVNRSMPYTSTKGIITAEVMAYRIYFAMTGKEVNFEDFDMPGAFDQPPLVINQKY